MDEEQKGQQVQQERMVQWDHVVPEGLVATVELQEWPVLQDQQVPLEHQDLMEKMEEKEALEILAK